jgi:hypothetical protein
MFFSLEYILPDRMCENHGMVGMENHGMVGMENHGMVGMENHGMVGMESHGMVGMESHGMVGMESHGMVGMENHGINNMHILASSPELQAVRFGYVILGEHSKNGSDPIKINALSLSG